ncbi:unnamed protein product, partial [Ectocarpus sp. 8 AP-2014]
MNPKQHTCFFLFRKVIDEDTLRNKRPESMSVSVHGLQALFVKPAQSLAPMVGMAFLPAGALKTDLVDMTMRQVCAYKYMHTYLCVLSAV